MDPIPGGPADPAGPEAMSETVALWSDTLSRFDEVPEALELLSRAEPNEDARRKKALLLLQSGRPSEALEVLDDGVQRNLPSDGMSYDDVLRAACWSETGHDGAYGWLRSRVLAAPTGEFLFGQWILAMVADQRGDVVLADQMWKAMVSSGEARTWETVAHYLAAKTIEARSDLLHGGAITPVAGTVLGLVQMPETLANRLDRDPRPILRARDLLIKRNETEAAFMLLTAARFGARPSKAVKDAYDQMAPKLPWLRWYSAIAIGVVFVLVATLSRVPGIGLPAAIATMVAWRRLVPVRGYSIEESRVLRILSRMNFNHKKRRAGVRGVLNMDVTPVMYAFVFAFIAAMSAVFFLYSVFYGKVNETVEPWIVIAAGLIGAVVGWQLGAWRASLGFKREHRRPTKVACQCATTSLLCGDVGAEYAERHLVPVGVEPMISGAQQLVCPQLGMQWLLVNVTPEAALYLMRGTTEALDANLPIERGAEGFYL